MNRSDLVQLLSDRFSQLTGIRLNRHIAVISDASERCHGVAMAYWVLVDSNDVSRARHCWLKIGNSGVLELCAE